MWSLLASCQLPAVEAVPPVVERLSVETRTRNGERPDARSGRSAHNEGEMPPAIVAHQP